MTGECRKGLAAGCRGALLGFVTVLLVAELAFHNLVARAYYDFNLRRLELIAVMAASAGAQHLPADPGAAVSAARSCAQLNGAALDEIVFIRMSSDERVLTIRLDRRIPKYMVLFFVGSARHDITVTASARRQPTTDSAPHRVQGLDLPIHRSSYF
jgi:hypothetical protein